MTPIQLRELRLSAYLSQAELGRALSISGSAISQAERGLTQLTDEHAERVRRVVRERKRILAGVERLVSSMAAEA
ncbi:MAG: helix-turn-helix domain-containing protein [Candidatus Acidiferrales bacterium]